MSATVPASATDAISYDDLYARWERSKQHAPLENVEALVAARVDVQHVGVVGRLLEDVDDERLGVVAQDLVELAAGKAGSGGSPARPPCR